MEERRQAILEELEKKGKVRVAELSRSLNCSEVTIRNDIKEMQDEGLLKRIHGGAVRLESNLAKKYRTESIFRNADRKEAIARRAYEYIDDGDTIIIDDASTSFYLALYIKSHPEKRIAVVTNSLLTGNELAGVGHVELYMIGGYVGGHLSATMGESALENMESFHVDKGFIGVHGINFEAGLTSIATPQMQVKRAILKASKEVYVLADSSKFGGGYLSVICPINQVKKIITDSQVSHENVEIAKEMGVPLVIA
ncbi:DeoR/GlpR transcriptional regulator [Lachnospiraceae bacterium KGMB03038]|nr:DeoR/GlpR transcriptional regulator [Lachnospiraceae bacterium KGMB03038]